MLTVLTVNTHKGFTALNGRFVLPELRDAVRATHADVVFLQEVVGEHSGHAERHAEWPQTPQYEFLADTLWPQFAYGRNAVYPAGHHGNAVLSKYPILRYQNRDASIARSQEKRGLLHCVLDIPLRGEVHAICVHLGLKESHRQRQLEVLCGLIADEVPDDAPLIVAGDFNDWRLLADRALRERCRLHEVFADFLPRPPKTFPARWPVLALDRIYVRNVKIKASRVLSSRPWPHLSDHLPLAAEVAL